MNVFTDDSERTAFLETLERVRDDASASVIAYCLMGNHFHLAIQIASVSLSNIMQRLMTSYATHFNRRHDRIGHLFQRRHEAKLCVDEAYLQRLIRYIHQNPVRAGFVKQARDWKWSSVAQFDDDGSGDDFSDFDPWLKESDLSRALFRATPQPPQDIERLAEAVSARSGVPLASLRSQSKSRRVVAAKRELAKEATRNGHTQQTIARWMSTSRTAVSNYLVTC